MRITAAVLVILAASAASAANLINKDKKKYELELVCDGAKQVIHIGPNTVQDGGIEKDCVVKLKKAKLTASGDKDVVIKNGKLSEEAPAPRAL